MWALSYRGENKEPKIYVVNLFSDTLDENEV